MAAKFDDWTGHTLRGEKGRYEVRKALGVGGMATVYLGLDDQGREVAVKVPKEAVLREEGFAARFKREIHSLIKLAHTNVLKVLDVGEVNGIPFAVLQYLALGSLRLQQPLDVNDGRVWPMSPEEIIGWLDPIAEALDYVYQKGYVHRDVKPENIMFDAEGNAFLGDFGVIKARADVHRDTPETVATGAGLVLGTPHYMAPEVLMGEPYDGRADQYSLAVTVYELLAARLPFPGDAPIAIVGHTTRNPPPISQFVRGLAPEVERVVLKGLSKRKEDRYASCRAFARAFAAAIPVAPTVVAGPKNAGEMNIQRGGPPRPAPPPVPTRTPGPMPVSPKTKAVICPYCEYRANLPDNVRSKAIRCGNCRKVYLLEAPESNRSGAATRQDQQALLDTRSDDRRRSPESRSKTPPSKKPAPVQVHSGPSVGEIIRFAFKWTITGIVVFAMLGGVYFGYGWFMERRANGACRESEIACNEANFTKALELADKAVASDSTYALGYCRRGRAKYFLADHEGALEDLNKAIELDSQLGLAYAYRSVVRFEEDYLDEAQDDVDRAIRLAPESGVGYASQAMILGQQVTQLSSAFTAADSAVAKERSNPNTLIARAYVREKQGKTTEAREDMRAATALPQGGAYPWAASSRFHSRKAVPSLLSKAPPSLAADLDQAKKDAQTALKTDPNSVAGHLAMAEYYIAMIQEKEARSEIEQVLRLSPRSTRGYELLAIVESELGRNYKGAIEALTRGIKLLPNSARLHYDRGVLHRIVREYDEAISDLSKAITINSHNVSYYSARATTYRLRGASGDTESARADDNRVSDLRNNAR